MKHTDFKVAKEAQGLEPFKTQRVRRPDGKPLWHGVNGIRQTMMIPEGDGYIRARKQRSEDKPQPNSGALPPYSASMLPRQEGRKRGR